MGYALQDGKSPLKKASSKGHVDVVKALIEAGANVNQADKVNMNLEKFWVSGVVYMFLLM